MGKKTEKTNSGEVKRRSLRLGALALLCVLGLGLLLGMSAFNSRVKPDRDMQWYVREGAMEVAAPALAEDAAPREDESEFVLPEENMRATPTPEPTPTPSPTPELTPIPLATEEPEVTPQVLADDEPYAPENGFEADADVDPDATPEPDASLEPDGTLEPAATPAITPEPEEEEPEGQVSLTITAVGDCTFGGMDGTKGQSRFNSIVEKYGYDYFFSNVRDIFEGDDLTIVNLEGPLSTRTAHKRGELFLFRADPECVKILSGSSVDLCNLANNHSQDCGLDGLKDTAKVLDENDIGFCAYNVAYEETIRGVRVCVLGFTKWERDTKAVVKAVAKARENCDLLIVNMHWGEEHEYRQNGAQTKAAHAIIDAGADLIIGTHPHVVQGIEKYKGKYIIYSLGNFSFAGNADPEDKRCLIFQQKFSFVPELNMAHAGCADAGINLIPASVTSTANKNDFRPCVMPAEQGKAVLKHLARYSTNFNMKDILWMRNNYLFLNGLMKTKEELEAEAAAAAAEGTAAAEGAAAEDTAAEGAAATKGAAAASAALFKSTVESAVEGADARAASGDDREESALTDTDAGEPDEATPAEGDLEGIEGGDAADGADWADEADWVDDAADASGETDGAEEAAPSGTPRTVG